MTPFVILSEARDLLFRSRQAGRRLRRGVPLIELIVVTALMAIIAGVVTPAFRAASPASDVSATAQLTAIIRAARARAIERATVVTLTVDPTTGRFWIDHPDTAGAIVLSAQANLSGGDRVHFRFRPTGEVAADPLAITESGVVRAVRVNRWTGEVTIGAH
jgi:prepilin-type N-terminal cleavage/methylation domain-containing protein